MSDPMHEGDKAKAARNWRNLAIAGALAVFVVLVFIVTIVKMGANVPH